MDEKLKNKDGVDSKSGPVLSKFMKMIRAREDYCPPGFDRAYRFFVTKIN